MVGKGVWVEALTEHFWSAFARVQPTPQAVRAALPDRSVRFATTSRALVAPGTSAKVLLLRVWPLWQAVAELASPGSWAGTFVVDYARRCGPVEHFLVSSGSAWVELTAEAAPTVPSCTVFVAPCGVAKEQVREWAGNQVRFERPEHMLVNIRSGVLFAVTRDFVDVVCPDVAARDALRDRFASWVVDAAVVPRVRKRDQVRARVAKTGRAAAQRFRNQLPD